MLRITETANALHYFRSALRHEEYYAQGSEFPGIWYGKLADQLGLDRLVTKEAFQAICQNLHPLSGEKLKPRNRKDAVPGWDFTVDVPKSVSLFYGLTEDKAILEAFHEASSAMLDAIESDIRTRVRSNGRNQDRTTENMLAALFVHTTSRPVDGIEDPHLHCHCWIPNLTFDSTEGKYKAAKMRYIWDQAPYYESIFDKYMIQGLRDRGFQVKTSSGGWEIAGISREVVQKFSRRTAQIEKVAETKNILNDKLKSTLGARTRNRKRKDMDPEALRESWWERLSDEEYNTVSQVIHERAQTPSEDPAISPDNAVEYACNICFKRKTLISDKRIIATALKYAGGWLSLEAISQALTSFIRKQGLKTIYGSMGQLLLTLPANQNALQSVRSLVKEGLNSCKPFVPNWQIGTASFLTESEQQSLQRVLSSYNRVLRLDHKHSLNPYYLQEASIAIKQTGKEIFSFSPTLSGRSSSIDTLFQNQRLQDNLKGQVIWIDSADHLDVIQMDTLLSVAKKQHARVILSNGSYLQSSKRNNSTYAITAVTSPPPDSKPASPVSSTQNPNLERALNAQRLARLSLIYANEFSHNLSMTR